MKTYTAIELRTVKGKYGVFTIGPCGDFHVVGDIRQFNSFDEACNVARKTATGEYGHEVGQFVSMR